MTPGWRKRVEAAPSRPSLSADGRGGRQARDPDKGQLTSRLVLGSPCVQGRAGRLVCINPGLRSWDVDVSLDLGTQV